jgi:hypothetical protein
MMQHGPGLAARPPAGNNLEVGRKSGHGDEMTVHSVIRQAGESGLVLCALLLHPRIPGAHGEDT